MSVYNFVKSSFNIDKLEKEIRESSITIALDYINSIGNDISIFFKANLSENEEQILSNIVQNHDGQPLPNQNIMNVVVKNPNGFIMDPLQSGIFGSSGITFISHDFGDRTTWYQKSIRVNDEQLVDSGDGLTFNSSNAHWVNIHSKRLMFLRNKVTLRTGGTGKHSDFEVIVKENGNLVNKSEYTVNYEAGTITFNSSKSGSTITCTYSHNNGVSGRSEWILAPQASKIFNIRHVEIQVSKTVNLIKPLRFEVWAGNTVNYFTSAGWPDALFDAGYGQMRADYQDVRGIINHCNRGNEIQAMPNAGIPNDVMIFPFDYIKSIVLKGSQMACIRIVCVDDEPVQNCDLCTVAFYAEVQDI